MKNDGVGRYFYEYAFHQVIEEQKRRTDAPLMVSQARHLRSQLDAVLGRQGLSMDDQLSSDVFINSMNEVMSSNIDGYESPFVSTGANDPFYQSLRFDMCDMCNMPHSENGERVAPVVGPMGERLPVSPYDPRFASRMSVKRSGSSLLYISGDDLDTVLDNSPAALESTAPPGLEFQVADDEGAQLRPAGMVVSWEDLAGLSELSSRMTQTELRAITPWVLASARTPQGQIDTEAFMSTDAVYRAAAVLDELRAQGVEYTIAAGRGAGQVQAHIAGTGINVRIMDKNEGFVGSVYDNGTRIYFSTTQMDAEDGIRAQYRPTAADSVNLVRIAQGKPVERRDGLGRVGENSVYSRGGVAVNSTYRTDDMLTMTYGDVPGVPDAKVLVQHNTKYRTPSPSYLGRDGEQKAEADLRAAVDSARSRFMVELDPVSLVSAATEWASADAESRSELVPDFSPDSLIAGYQREYWDFLTGKTQNLLRPGADRQAYDELVGSEVSLETRTDREEYDATMRRLTYQGSMSQQFMEHTRDVTDAVIGTYELHDARDASGSLVQQRFDPSYVSKYMTSSNGIIGNNRMIVAAMRVLDIPGDDLMGDDFVVGTIKDRLVAFDETSAMDMLTAESDFIRGMGEHIAESLKINGVDATSIRIDEQGVVSYEGSRARVMSAYARNNPQNPTQRSEFTGYLGQIWEPDELGAIRTKFAGSENYLYVPGYEASVLPQKPGETKTLEERTVARGYEQMMRDQISYRIASDVLEDRKRSELGSPDSLNRVHRTLYSERHPTDFVEKSIETGLGREWVEGILKTEGRRVRYGNQFAEGSTIHAEYTARNSDVDMSNDNFSDPWVLSGGRNMGVLTKEGDPFFDPIMTGQAKTQGVVRFLTESAQVDPSTGLLILGEEGDRTPLMKLPGMKYAEFNPFDRQQMTASNVMKAESIVPSVHIAQATLRNWNLDDAIVVSSEFAESHLITGADGQSRPLTAGDKLSDLNGNKGVISLVVDRTMSDETAKEAGLEAEVEFFKENANLDVVMSPFSAISRYNGGSARELMENATDLVHADTVIEGGIGEGTLIVTHKAADKVTNIYGEEELAAGKGRKASGQYAWVLEDRGCDAVFSELYGTNNASVVAMREYLNVVGLDIEPDGTLRQGREDHGPEDGRKVFTLPETMPYLGGETGKRTLDRKSLSADFAKQIDGAGGVLELPWQLDFPAGGTLANHTDSTYELPVLSSSLRSGQEFIDGRSVQHDYTQRYTRIYEEAAKYTYAVQRLDSGENLSDDMRRAYEIDKAECQQRAQTQFNALTHEVIERQFEGKHNIVRDKVMSHRVPNSATAILTPDPRLGLEQVGMNESMMDALGVKAGERVLVHRDPMLHNGGLRYMEVTKANEAKGVVINPAAAKSFEGDFDGDTFGVIALKSDAAKAEAMAKLSPEANMLDISVPSNDSGEYPLFFQMGLDHAIALKSNPEFVERMDDIRREINLMETDLVNGADLDEIMDRRLDMMEQTNSLYHDMSDSQIVTAAISFANPQAHMESVLEACVDTGAKGDEKKALEYAQYLGLEVVEATPNSQKGRNDYVFKDVGHTLHTREQDEGVQYAVGVKSMGTGIAGSFSQRAVREIRNGVVTPTSDTSKTLASSVSALTAANNVTSKLSQAMLQAKKDPIDAYRRYQLSSGPVRDLMKGVKLDMTVGPDGAPLMRPMRDEKNQLVKATKEEWVEQTVEVFTQKWGLGVDVNPEMVRVVADALEKPDGTVRGFEPESTKESQYSTAKTMDRLAYGGSFAEWVEAAQSRENLYDGAANRKFAPAIVSANLRESERLNSALDRGEAQIDVSYKPIIAKDVRPRPGEARSVATLPTPSVQLKPSAPEGEVDASAPSFAAPQVETGSYQATIDAEVARVTPSVRPWEHEGPSY